MLNGKLFTSPSAAGVSAIDRSTVNGWRFWKYQNPEGKWGGVGGVVGEIIVAATGDRGSQDAEVNDLGYRWALRSIQWQTHLSLKKMLKIG